MPNLPAPMNQGMPQGQSPMGQLPSLEGMQEMGNEEPTNILAHFTPQEVTELDEMQGQVVIDPETGLRDYTMLEFILKDPQIQDYIAQTLGSPEKRGFAEGGFVGNEEINEPGRPILPELEQLREEGRGQDTELAIITTDIAKIFEEMNGGKTNYNPTTGFPEYGFLKQLGRIAAGIGGFLIGGPLGAAVGAGLAHKATGDSWGGAFKAAAIGFGAGAGFNFAAPGLGFGNAAIPTSSSMLGSYLPSWAGGAASSNVAGSGGFGAEHAMVNQARAMAFPAATQAGGQGGFLNSLMTPSTLIPLGAAGLMAFKGASDEKKQQEEHERQKNAEEQSLRSRFGFDEKIRGGKPYELVPNNQPLSEEDLRSGIQQPHFIHKPNYGGGGAIRGIGKGQQDNIPKDIKKNSYIIDASSVSDIGDGSSQAGIKELNNFFAKIPTDYKQHEAKGGFIKAMVSPDEYEVEPEVVTAIGKGSNEKGAKILEKFIKQVRKQKRTSGDKLPPKAKPISGYLKQMHTA
jgi:hypothetical protein